MIRIAQMFDQISVTGKLNSTLILQAYLPSYYLGSSHSEQRSDEEILQLYF